MSGATWTSQDTMNLRRLLMKAQEQGVPIAELAAEVENPNLTTSWDLVGADQTPGGYFAGAMTDAAKRRHEAVSETAPDPQLPIAGRMPSVAMPKAMVAPPFPVTTEVNPLMLTDLPEGIPDLATWGDMLIDFGKYKGENRSYAELVASTSPRAVSYRKWVLSHTRSSSNGDLIDLYKYLKQVTPGTSTVMIPGTNKPRVFK